MNVRRRTVSERDTRSLVSEVRRKIEYFVQSYVEKRNVER